SVQLAQIDSNGVTTGVARLQSSGPFSVGSVSGSFAANFAGTNLVSTGGGEDIAGIVNSDGAGNLSGTLGVNNSGVFNQGASLSNGSHTSSAPGRGTSQFQLSSSHLAYQT